MPYRRLPNTDNARIRALKTAIEKSSNTDFRDIAINMRTLHEAKKIVSQFERLCDRYQQTFNTQTKANKSFQQKARNARMYVSHFVQVLYMCVARLEIKEEYLELYSLSQSNMVVPDISSNEALLEWGEKIIKGEESRIAKGGVPIFTPSIAKVKVMFSMFREGYQTQQIHQKATNRTIDEVAAYRQEVDKIIFDIWEQVERKNTHMEAGTRIEKNRDYGVIYYYRKGEAVE